MFDTPHATTDAAPTPGPDPSPSGPGTDLSPGGGEPPHRTDRRRLLTGFAGAAAAGLAVGTLKSSGPALAADTDPITVGADSDGTLLTQLRRPTGATDIDVFAVNDAAAAVTSSSYPAALGAGAAGNTVYNGVHGLASSRDDADVTTGFGLIGNATDAARAPIWLVPRADPNDDAIGHQVGEIVVDADGHFWACVASGTPGTWIDLAAPLVDTTTLQPQYFPIDPIRCYDSRVTTYTENGPLAPNEMRVVSVADSYDRDGVLLKADAVPAGATAVTYNITIAQPTGHNFLSVAAGDATDPPAVSSINFDAGRNDANGLTGPVDDERRLAVFCGDDTGSTDFIVDVNGYYLAPTVV